MKNWETATQEEKKKATLQMIESFLIDKVKRSQKIYSCQDWKQTEVGGKNRAFYSITIEMERNINAI